MIIRTSRPEDRQAVLDLVESTGFFHPGEVSIAAEVLDDALGEGPEGHYQSFTADDHDGHPVGWVCYGPTPCTVGTFDLYWIAVAPGRQGRGLGKALMAHAEKLIAERGGRLVVVETSGAERYHATRQFYLRVGYQEAARIRDFYAPGDDKVVFTKCLTGDTATEGGRTQVGHT